jgi:hypothetical protein
MLSMRTSMNLACSASAAHRQRIGSASAAHRQRIG